MGGKQSALIHTTSDVSGDDNDCNCFFFKLPFKSNDPIGSPMPETPLHQRAKRSAIKTALNKVRESPVFSSKYGGLEKEVDYCSKALSSIEDQENGHRAEVHEGKVSIILTENLYTFPYLII